ncbi:hypothetical protein [Streptomyces varsoviensis]|uniref:Fibronectin type-III domain-containing protein n=1 Tax=Streptomyces varsoviensis TaxID=67373 RepID=A0ABR5J7E7_9ACTN|nr:hypothetical protein [Streptomyces varsoviensis]KOG89343.1 hypothetical protein ADK38_14855 [Streptomyces varsoviensis]
MYTLVQSDSGFSIGVITTPNPLQANGATGLGIGDIEIRIAPLTPTAQCDSVRITIPCGSTPEDLTERGGKDDFQRSVSLLHSNTRWTASPPVLSPDTKTSSFTVHPDKDKDKTLTAADPLCIKLSKVQINKMVGTTWVEVAINKDAAVRRQVTKAPPGFEFHSLEAKPQLVDNGKSTRLSWHLNKPAKLELNWVGFDEQGYAHESIRTITDGSQGIVLTADTEALHNHSFFRLTAEVGDSAGNNKVHCSLSTMVFVNRGTFQTGPLIVTGTTKVMGQAQLLAGSVKATGTDPNARKTYTPDTDGIVCASLTGNGKPAQITFIVSDAPSDKTMTDPNDPPGTPLEARRVTLTSAGDWNYTEFFVAAGNYFTIGGVSEKGSGISIRWIPLGAGTITPSG